MDEDFWDPDLKRYVEILIERAPGRPVLQFNRIDFRLPWFRRHFPDAKIVHLYRHPRDQWCSALMDVKCFPRHGRVEDFAAHDKFYLLKLGQRPQVPLPVPGAGRRRPPVPALLLHLEAVLPVRAPLRRPLPGLRAPGRRPGRPSWRTSSACWTCAAATWRRCRSCSPPRRWGSGRSTPTTTGSGHHETICETILADFFGAGAAAGPAPHCPSAERGRARPLANGTAELQAS